jgi:hypothetical protein
MYLFGSLELCSAENASAGKLSLSATQPRGLPSNLKLWSRTFGAERKLNRFCPWRTEKAELIKGEQSMKQNNNQDRVLSRQGARELTPSEAEIVTGAYKVAFTLCTGVAGHGDLDCR